jgi:DNA-binding CsgD family transcriptional regulator
MNSCDGCVDVAIDRAGRPGAGAPGLTDAVPADAPPLRGRDSERQAIADLLAAPAGGGTVLVEGPAGIGKTRLLTEGAALAVARGFTVVQCSAAEDGGLLPLAPLLAALDHALASRARTEPAGGLSGLVGQLTPQLRERAGAGILLTVDDLHCAGDAAVRRLHRLRQRPAAQRLTWLLARRPGAGGAEMERRVQALADEGASRVPLPALPAPAAADLFADVLGAAPDPPLLALAAGAGGNPLLLVQLALGLQEEGAVETVHGRARLVSAALPQRVQRLARQRLDRLGEVARRLVDGTAVVGGACPLDDLVGLLGSPVSHVLTALAEAAAGGVLTVTLGTVRFQQDLVRRAAADMVPAATWQALRRQVDQLLLRPRPTAAAAPDVPASPPDGHPGDAPTSPARPARAPLLADRAAAAMAANIRSRLHLAAGRVAEAVSEAQLGLADAEALEQELLVPHALSTLATVALRRGDLAAAAAHIDRCRARLRAATEPTAVLVSWLAGQLAAAQAEPGWAMDPLLELYDDPHSVRLLLSEEPVAAGWLVRNALAGSDRRRAREVTTRAAQLAEDHPDNPELAAGAAHARGLLDGSTAALRYAAGTYRDPWARSSAAEDLGVLSARSGTGEGRREAIGSLDEALAGYGATSALRDAARVHSRLRKLGVRRQQWSRTEGPASGWASLTAAERAVADLVAAGLTNRQVAARLFVSPHTVAFHLRRIFRKLEVTSRVELASLAARQTQEQG